MPFKSKAQRVWMFANKPEMAKQWEADTKSTRLPERVKTRSTNTNKRVKKAKLPKGGIHQ